MRTIHTNSQYMNIPLLFKEYPDLLHITWVQSSAAAKDKDWKNNKHEVTYMLSGIGSIVTNTAGMIE